MGAELRIDDGDVVRAAEELAALLKMSVPDAVAEALRVRLEREVRAKVERIMAAAASFWGNPATAVSFLRS